MTMDRKVESGGASLQYEGAQRLVDILNEVADPENRNGLMDVLGAYGVSSTQQRFLDQKDPDGTVWKASHRAKTQGGKTLRESNQMFTSLTFEAGRDEVRWGTNKIYAGIHQFGGVITPKTKPTLAFRVAGGRLVLTKKVTIPARPFLGVNSQDEVQIVRLGETWLQKMAGGRR